MENLVTNNAIACHQITVQPPIGTDDGAVVPVTIPQRSHFMDEEGGGCCRISGKTSSHAGERIAIISVGKHAQDESIQKRVDRP